MISLRDVFDWLNWEMPSEITDEVLFWVQRIEDPSLLAEEKIDILQDLANTVARLTNPLEQAETLLFCGAVGHELGMKVEPARWLQRAADIYDDCTETHRFAVALWAVSIIQHDSGKYRMAYFQARQARKLFIQMANSCLVKKEVKKESWYRGRALDITSELISTPEYMFECLFEFKGMELSPSAAEMKSRISSEIERNRLENIKSDIRLLLGITARSANPKETGEALAFCGMVSWLLEDILGAVPFFRSAMAQFTPASFEYAVIQWMLGLILFSIAEEKPYAIIAMESSIKSFDALRQKAVKENKMEQVDWFAIHHLAMKRILRTQVESN